MFLTAPFKSPYDLAKLKPEAYRSVVDTRQTVAYVRVSSSDQKEDLNHQQQALKLYCDQQGWSFRLISD